MSALADVYGRWSGRRRSPRKQMQRRSIPIHGYIGPNGGGKTTAAVWDTLPSLEAGRPVLSTVRLLDYQNPRPCDDETCDFPNHGDSEHVNLITGEVIRRQGHRAAHPLWIPWTRWGQLLEIEHADVIADEITGVASSRESQSMPARVANQLVQLRRKDVVMRWTAPSWARADLILRECSQGATLCTGAWSVEVEGEGNEVARMWLNRRLFRWRTFDAQLLDEISAAKLLAPDQAAAAAQTLRPEIVDWHWGPESPAFAAFDTFDAVSSLGQVADVGGRCETCHGRRSVPSCSCPEYVDRPRRGRKPADRGGVPAQRGTTATADGTGTDDVSDNHGGSLAVPLHDLARSDA